MPAHAQSWDELAGSGTGGGVSNEAGSSLWPDIALDSSGNPHIAWHNCLSSIICSGYNEEIYYAYWEGDSWETHSLEILKIPVNT